MDLIGMTRAHMGDPYLVEKLRRGEDDRIRPCVGLGYCVDRVNQGKDAVCGHNAATGREATMSHLFRCVDQRKKVVVVGGGPAGLDAARVCAERGYSVVLFEASDQLRGQLKLATTGMTRRQIWCVADWLIEEITRLGVTLHTNTYAETDDITAEGADVVIVATDGWPEAPSFPGAALATSSWDVMSGQVRTTGDVLLNDEVGDHAAMVCADVMARAGCTVTVVTPDRSSARDLGPTNSAVVLRDLAGQGVDFVCFQDITAISETGNRKTVTMRNILTGEISQRVVDYCVVEHGLTPNDALYHQLKGTSVNLGQLDQGAMISGQNPFRRTKPADGFLLVRIGDAVAGRNIHAALYDALRVCKDI